MYWLTLPYVDVPQGTSTPTVPGPVFRSGVDCPASVWSAIRSCPDVATWFALVALGGVVVGYLYATRR